MTGRSAPVPRCRCLLRADRKRTKDTGKPVEPVEPVVVAGNAEERALFAVVVRLENRVPRRQETRFDFGGGGDRIGGIAPEKQDVTAWQCQLAVVVGAGHLVLAHDELGHRATDLDVVSGVGNVVDEEIAAERGGDRVALACTGSITRATPLVSDAGESACIQSRESMSCVAMALATRCQRCP